MPIADLLYHISLTFQKCLNNPDEALREALELIMRAVRFDRAALYLFDDKEQVLRPRKIITAYGEIDGEGENFFHVKRGGHFIRALTTGAEVIRPGSPEWSMYVPLIVRGKKLGVLRVDNSLSRRPLSDQQIDGMKRCVEPLGMGVYSVLVHEHFMHQVNKLTIMTQIGTAIGSSLKITDMLQIALSSLVRELGYDRAQLYLLNEAGDAVRENMSIDFSEKVRSFDDPDRIPDAVRELIPDKRPSFLVRKFSPNLAAHIPIKVKDRKIGMLMVDNLFRREALTPNDLSFLTILAEQLATVIENSRLFEKVERLSITDSLTGLFNHRYFYERLSEEMSRANRFGNPLALILLDLDYFKNFNDTFGHQAGDTVLKTVSEIILRNVRSIDVVSRYGGEEIAIILPETDIEGAKSIAERIRSNIAAFEFVFESRPAAHITGSMGLVCYPVDATVKEDLIRKADVAMYWVKNHGRNGVCAYSRCEDL